MPVADVSGTFLDENFEDDSFAKALRKLTFDGWRTCQWSAMVYSLSVDSSMGGFTWRAPKSEDKRKCNPRRPQTRPLCGNAVSRGCPDIRNIQSGPELPRELFSRISKTKDDLINSLYREIKLELAERHDVGFPAERRMFRTRLRHVLGSFM